MENNTITEEIAKSWVKQYQQIQSGFSVNCTYTELAKSLNEHNIKDFVDFVILVES